MGFGRTFLYHHSCPNGFIFTDEDEFKAALRDGWVEAPWLVGEPDEAGPVIDEVIATAKDTPLPPAQPPAKVEKKRGPNRRTSKNKGVK